jgi:hypothetical protein
LIDPLEIWTLSGWHYSTQESDLLLNDGWGFFIRKRSSGLDRDWVDEVQSWKEEIES